MVDRIIDVTSFRHLYNTSRTVSTDLRHIKSIIKIWFEGEKCLMTKTITRSASQIRSVIASLNLETHTQYFNSLDTERTHAMDCEQILYQLKSTVCISLMFYQ